MPECLIDLACDRIAMTLQPATALSVNNGTLIVLLYVGMPNEVNYA
jgi:hypothetical protein